MKLAVKFMTILTAAVITAALLPVPAARAEFTPADWQYYRIIQEPAPGPDGFVGVPVDAALFDRGEYGFSDLRLIGPDGKEIPYVLVIQRGAPKETVYTPAMINAAVVPGQHQELVLDLGERGKKNNEITLQTAAANFKRPVKVYGGDDAAAWKLIREGFSIFDFSGDVHARDLTLRYPENIFRYLEVEIGLDGGEPLTISGAAMRSYALENQQLDEYEATVTSSENEKLKASELMVDFHHTLPLCELELAPEQPEFYRRIEIVGYAKGEYKIAEGVIYRYTVGDFRNEQTSVSVPEGKNRDSFMVRIFNLDNPALTVKKVTGRVYRRVLVFRPPAGEVRLYYGWDGWKSKPPSYDLATLYPKLAENIPPLGTILPAEQPNPDYQAPVVQAPVKPKDYRWAMWLLIIVVGGFLAFLVFRSMSEVGGKGEGKDGGKDGGKE